MKDKPILTPQQQLFLSYYIDPESETFSNAKSSALEAKYSEEYANNITNLMPKWLSEFIGQDNVMLMKAERNLNRFLDEIRDKKIALDATKFVAERLGKKKYSLRSEVTGPNGKDLAPTFIVQTPKAKEELLKLYEGPNSTNDEGVS